MAKYPLSGPETAPVRARHGKGGFVQMNVTVPTLMKTKLIESARKRGLTLADEVRVALAQHLKERS